MEDGDINSTKVSATINADKNKDSNKMANYPDVEVTVIKNKTNTDCKTSENCAKVNGESEKNNSDEQEEYTSDEDALIIDEECKKIEIKSNSNHKRKRSPSPRANFKGFKKRIIAKSVHLLKITKEIWDTYYLDWSESIFGEEKVNITEDIQGELNSTISKDIRNDNDNKTGIKDKRTPVDQKNKKLLGELNIRTESPKNKNAIPSLKSSAKKTVKKRPSQKLTEYAQYLGLQPAVKFKCVKCSESSFPSLSALNEHQRQCLVQPPSSKPVAAPSPVVATPSSTNFRVTRKVFLCSSCGTYYENCNLFLHMREVHRRYICLYCLGMFSLPEKLTHHLVTKHNCSPDHYSSADDFLNSYRESCFLVCCHCETVFSERDNFFHHECVDKQGTLSEKSCWSCGVKGLGSHSAICKASTEQPPSTSIQTQKSSNKSFHQKSIKHKTIKNSTKISITPAEHITADSPSTSLISSEVEPEANAAEHFMAIMSSSLKNESVNLANNMSNVNSSPNSSSFENKNVYENTFEAETVLNKVEKKSTAEMINDVGNSVENNNSKMNEASKIKDEKESNQSFINPDIEDKILDHNDDIVSNTITENNSDSINDTLSSVEHNNTVEENTPCDNNLKSKNKEGTGTSDFQFMSENKEVSQISTDLELSNNEADEEERQIENCDIENIDDHDEQEEEPKDVEKIEETRKVPKVTLKLPPLGLIYSENESDDSEKLTMEVDEYCESDNECDESQDTLKVKNESSKPVNGIDENEKESDHSDDEMYQIAGEDVPIVELELEQPLDKFSMENLLKICLNATISMCVYCNHARKIAVNGKQLGLHAIAEHRFAATVNSITAEELIPKNFVTRIKESLDDVELLYFCLEEKEKSEEEIKEDGSTVSSFKRIYECFQCRYVTTIHKELYLHNRKMHAKTILLCIMCKSNFYSYSELICHLCPGEYVLNSETRFRCCMCETNDLPSAFRLMVHLRKRHHTCDVCLEGCNNQSKLSNHVWKHKLHHLCYRCGIAYRNKPDITKHLFWKHGTESVLCKKCLQKKWPHVYHFCIPPISFVCEECNLSFSKAVYLKVHKRLHSSEKPHICTEESCPESFISKKLLFKHELKHKEPVPIENLIETIDNKETNDEKENEQNQNSPNKDISSEIIVQEFGEKEPNSPTKEEIKKNIIDVYDLPALNLSETDSDSDEEEKPKLNSPAELKTEESKILDLPLPDITPVENETIPLDTLEEEQKPVPILDGIWDNFKNYQATLEKKDTVVNIDLNNKDIKDEEVERKDDTDLEELENIIPDLEVIMADHDYCTPALTTDNLDMEIDESRTKKTNECTDLDHDYCTVATNEGIHKRRSTNSPNQARTLDNLDKKKIKTPKKKISKHNISSSSSDSSSDSDSSSCTCGSNCSCSSSSGSSSSSSSSSESESSSSEGKRRIQARKERRKERAKRKKESETSLAASNTSAVDVVATEDNLVPVLPVELPIQESDLDTTETETDEDFYDEHPQRLANKILAEKRNQLALLAAVAPVNNGTILESSRPSTPSIPEEISSQKKKMKSKKRKKKSRSSTPKQEIVVSNIPDYHNHQSPIILEATLPVTPIIPPMVSSPLTVAQPVLAPPSEKLKINVSQSTGSGSETETNVRSSKRRRVPNKFYGYSSDDEATEKPPATPVIKWRKSDLPTVTSQFVPPITIKNIPSPSPVIEPVRAPVIHHSELPESDSDTEDIQHRKSTTNSSDSNRNDDSDSDTGQLHISQPTNPSISNQMGTIQRTNENLYCYCQCPYDEVSEMIACDGKDCAIEWFHFECVGIMVPPKGKWYCPDCRKKSLSRSECLQT